MLHRSLWCVERNSEILRSAQDDRVINLGPHPERGEVGEAFGGDPAGGAVEVEGPGAALLGEALVEGRPMTGLFPVNDVERESDEGVEEVVELVFVAEVRPDLFADGGDGSGVDFARFVR